MNGLTFDGSSHTYRYNGVVVPSVTGILKSTGFIPDCQWVEDYHLEKGRYVHLACELYDLGKLDYASVDSAIEPYLQSYIRFRELSTNITIKAVEERVYSASWGFAGTLDREIIINGRPAILDLKSGVFAKWHQLQLAGYSIAKKWEATHQRYCLYLQKDGSPARLSKPFTALSDYQVFKSAVTCYKFNN